MSNPARQAAKLVALSTGDIWGGLAAMLVALPSSIAYGVLVYTALGPEYAGEGAVAGIIGAAVIGIVASFVGRTAGLISAPCAPAAAVLSALIAGLVAGKVGGPLSPAVIMPLVALSALIAAALQILYGIVGGGKLIKFLPYPVVSGYLSGVGVLIALGQLPKLFGLPKKAPLLAGLASPELWKWPGLATGAAAILCMALAPRITKRMPAPIFGLAGGVAAFIIIGLFVPELLTLRGNPFVIGPIEMQSSFAESVIGRASSLLAISTGDLGLIIIPALTLSALLSIDTLKTCVVLDAMTGNRHNSNRELIGQGVGNLAAFLAGGMPGSGTMGPTLINVTSGGRTFRSGIIEGILVVLSLALLSPLIAWVPIAALAGILLVIAWRMFDKNMFNLLRYPSGRLDFAVISGVIIVAVSVDLIAASGVGVGLAILLFIRDQIRGSVLRRKQYLNQTSSKTRRLANERAILDTTGDQAVFCELQGNLFFGTTDQLFTQIEPDLRTKRFVLFDMRRVQSMDYTAAHLFDQMNGRLAARDGRLLLSGIPTAMREQQNFEEYLTQLGIVGEGGGVIIFETLDSALEWMEQRLLEAAGVTAEGEERPLETNEIELFGEFDAETVALLDACLERRSVPAGGKVFSQGDSGDEMFFVRRGSVRVMLPLEGGKRHHLATIGQGDFFGELSFLDRGIRSADVEAKTDTDLFVLSRSCFDERCVQTPTLGETVFARLALAIALRLRQTDAELRMLEER